MATVHYVLQLRQGDTKTLTLQYQEADGDPVDITGYDFEWFVTSGGVDVTYTDSPEITVVDAPTGVIRLKLSATETAALIKNKASYWFRGTAPNGTVFTLLKGPLDVDEI